MNDKTWMCERCGHDENDRGVDYCQSCGWERPSLRVNEYNGTEDFDDEIPF